MTQLVDAPRDVVEDPAPPRAGRSRALLGLVPFVLYLLVFLGGPLYFVISGALSDPDGRPTLDNVVAALTEPQYRVAFASSVALSVVTALVGAVFGTFLAQAVLTSRPDSPLRRIMSTASGVLAYFGGVPLAFAFIAALGQTGLATLWLRGIGLDLYAAGFRIDSLTGLGLTYVYFQVPLMVILVTPALEGLLPQWREAAENLGASAWEYWRHVALPVLAPARGRRDAGAVRQRLRGLRHGAGPDQRVHPAGAHRDRHGPVGQRDRRTAERRAGAGPGDGRRHLGRDGRLPAAAAAGLPVDPVRGTP